MAAAAAAVAAILGPCGIFSRIFSVGGNELTFRRDLVFRLTVNYDQVMVTTTRDDKPYPNQSEVRRNSEKMGAGRRSSWLSTDESLQLPLKCQSNTRLLEK